MRVGSSKKTPQVNYMILYTTRKQRKRVVLHGIVGIQARYINTRHTLQYSYKHVQSHYYTRVLTKHLSSHGGRVLSITPVISTAIWFP